MSYIVDRRDLDFILRECFDLDRLLERPGFRHLDREMASSILDMAEAIAEEVYLPCAARLDAHEPEFVGGRAKVIDEVRHALREYAEAGLCGASFPEALGGAQLPCLLAMAVNGMFMAANIGIANYSFLTNGAAQLIAEHGDAKQKEIFLPPMIAGRWLGTMCLSEPQAGSSLADIRTQATPVEGQRFSISGSKMWISGGDHDLSENIVHMVLARIPGGSLGAKGISLFIVPKFLPREDGEPGSFNNIVLAGLNHKMGQRGTANCLLNFGEDGPCIGFLVGQAHEGLSAMFRMMNEARIYVGHTAAMLGLAGYLYSLDYARSRPQGRRQGNKNPGTPQIPIIEHADVRRMLLEQKVAVEGSIALSALGARLVDDKASAETDEARADAALLLELLIPIIKSWPAEHCLEANKQAMQILGGYGYTRDYPVERLYRDNRLNPIHEGTYGIHGIDLLGRKVRLEGGRALEILEREIEATLQRCESFPAEAAAMRAALVQLNATTAHCLAERDLEKALANATPYLDAMGTLVVSWLWLMQGNEANIQIGKGETNCAFYAGKIKAARYMVQEKLATATATLARIAANDAPFFSMASEEFARL